MQTQGENKMGQDALLERQTPAAEMTGDFLTDNVVTRAEQGHLTLLDWQPGNPLEETERMPRLRRRRGLSWYETGMIALILTSLAASIEVLAQMAG